MIGGWLVVVILFGCLILGVAIDRIREMDRRRDEAEHQQLLEELRRHP